MFSVIVPVYNVEGCLKRCLESVVVQDCHEYEVIVVDDGSADASGKIADEYAEKYGHIKVIHQENGGLSSARNSGIAEAEGDYIVFLDSDDYLCENALCQMADGICRCPNADVYYLKILRRNADGTEQIRCKRNLAPNVVYSGEQALKAELSDGTRYMAMAQCGVYRRSFIVENALFFQEGILHEDEQWSPRVALKARSVVPLDIVFYGYIVREGSITTSKNQLKNARHMLMICDELRQLSETQKDGGLKKLLLCYIAKLYIHAVSIALREGESVKADRSYVMGKWRCARDFFRLIAFAASPKLYAKHIDARWIR